jgi:hypothetical protein
VSVTFPTVETAGVTTVSCTTTSFPSLPPDFYLDTQFARYYLDVSTTAVFSGEVEFCLTWPFPTLPATATVWHFEGGGWVDVTGPVDPVERRICGRVGSLSPFAVGELVPPGLVPSDADAARCGKGGVAAVKRLHRSIGTCHATAAQAAIDGVPFDEAACEAAARGRFETAIGRLAGCTPCQDENTPGLGATVQAQADSLSGGPYCDGAGPLGDEEMGFIPASSAGATCAKKMTRLGGRLMNRILGCRVRSAARALAGAPFDRGACEARARRAYDTRAAATLGGCAPCLAANATAVRDQAEGYAGFAFAQLHCSGSGPIP